MNNDYDLEKVEEVEKEIRNILEDNKELSDKILEIIQYLYNVNQATAPQLEKRESFKAGKGKVTVTDFEEFLMELYDIVKSIQLVSDLLDTRDEFVAEDIAPIIRLFDHDLSICYNHFSRLGEAMYNNPYRILPSRDSVYDKIFTRIYSESKE